MVPWPASQPSATQPLPMAQPAPADRGGGQRPSSDLLGPEAVLPTPTAAPPGDVLPGVPPPLTCRAQKQLCRLSSRGAKMNSS